MPRESSNHSNLGLSLAIVGDWDSAEKEERKALQLDKSNSKAEADPGSAVSTQAARAC